MTVMMDSGDDDDDDGMRNHFKVLMALSIVSRVRSHFTPLGVTDSLQSRKYPAVYKWRADVMLMLIMGIILVMSDNDDDPNDHADYDGQSKIWCFRGRNHRFFLHFYIPFLNTSKKTFVSAFDRGWIWEITAQFGFLSAAIPLRLYR